MVTATCTPAPVATTTALVSSLNPAASGASVTFTATVTGSSPSGTVTFYDGAATLGSPAVSGGVATYATSSLSAATHNIVAIYNGDSNNTTSTSNTVNQVINPPPPSVTGISPATGPVGGATPVTISGTGFLTINSTGAVKFGANNATYTVNSDTQISATSPSGSAGTTNVTVTNAGGTSATSGASQFTYYVPAPTVTAVAPISGPLGGTNSVTITGTGFLAAASTGAVKFGASTATYTIDSDIQITATAPSSASPGTVDITVTNSGGTSATSSADHYTYVAAPTVSSISPTAGPTGAGTTVVIGGTGFSAAPGTGAVKFGATTATYTIDSDSQITATAPAGSAGTTNVTVTTPGGTSATSGASQYTRIAAPTVTNLSVTSGPTAGGTTVVLTGTDFSGVTAVTFGITAAASYNVDSSTQITAVTDAASASSVNVQVTAIGGTSATGPGNIFTFVAPPTIGAPSPASGPTAGGASVTLTGTNLSNATLTVDGQTVTPTSANATTIIFTTPSHVAGSVAVIVTTVGGTASTSYTYVAAPTIGAPSPASGPTAGGTAVTLTGTNLTGATLTVDGAGVTPTSNDGTTLTFTTPAHVGGGAVSVSVTTTGGSASTSFTYVAPPVASPYTAAAVAYNVANTTFSIASAATNSPTSFAVGSATTANGGSVSVDSAGLVTYSAPTGFRGNDSFSYTATNLGGTSAPGVVTVPVGNPTLSSSLTGSGTRGTALSGVQITTTGGRPSYSCSTTLASGALPSGTQLNANCTITGTPTASGTNFTFTANVTDSSTGTGGFTQTTGTLTLSIAAPTISLSPASGALPGATVGTFYSQSFTASGGTATYGYADTGTLPTGLTLAGGTLSGTPTTAGTYNFDITTTDSSTGGSGGPYSRMESYSISVAKGSQAITFNALANASLSASPLTLSASASSTLTVAFASTTTGVCTVSGTTLTLLTTGTCSITASQAGDANWNAASDVVRSFTVTPANLTISDSAAANATVGLNYSQANPAAGGVSPYNYALISGAFPLGTSLDPATGTVSGTLTAAGSFSYQLRVTDSQGPAVSADGNIVTVNIAKGSQVITADPSAPASVGVGSTPYTLADTTNSGLTVSYVLDGSSAGCALSGATLTFTSTGTCRVNANQAGDSNWNPAAQVQHVISISPAGAITVSVSFSTSTLRVGQSATATITFTNPNASASPNIAPLFNGSALISRGALGGSCGASGSDSGANFQFNGFSIPANGSCTVTLGYTGTTPGSVGGLSLSAFTPSGYPTTASAGTSGFVVTPRLDAISPNSGPVSQVVTLSGAGFSTTPGNNSVDFGGAPGTVTAASATSLTVTAPAIGTGAKSVTVTVNGQASDAQTYTFIAPPTAGNTSATVAYDTATPIDLTSFIGGGPHSSIATSTPTNGTTSVSGDIVTYTPNSGYVGADSFTYTATGAGGTSSAGTVTITVTAPPAPVTVDKNGVAVPYNGTGTAIDLSTSITGVRTGIAASQGANGTTSVAGYVVTYTPNAGYYGVDSFTYTATGPGGTSNTSTVTVTVGNPPAPVTADRSGVAVPYASTGTAIDLASSITGVHSGITVASGPANGTTSVAGDVVTYTPNAGYYGADSFTYTATGPGGTSAASTVSITVATPGAPVTADRSGVGVPYASTGTAIDLTSSITGVHSSIAIGTVPAHGTATVAGDVVTYTPASGYYGADSFTYAATGPGGTSTPSTVSLTVATPAAPTVADKPGVVVAYNSTGTAIDLSASITGVHSSIAIATVPAHGSVSIAGDVVTYTPTAGYFGADGFTFTATGPGGTSSPATVSLTVTTPPAPVVADRSGVAVPYASTGTAIDLSGAITGVHSAIAIGTAPAHGTVSIAGDVVTYTPAATYYGADSFTYTATGPGGTSAPATVSLTVATPPAPVVADKSGVAVPYASAGTAIDLSASITGVRASIAVATMPAHGTVAIAGEVVTYTPVATYYGADSFTYTATGPGGTSAPATVSVTVATPAAPTAANRSGVTIAYNSTGTAIDLASSVTGVHSALAISTAPTHGTATVNGDVVTYTPTAGYYGADSFGYTATGPGGTSAAATVSLTVATPPPPVAAPGSGSVAGSTTTAGTSVNIDLSALVTGVYDTIQIATPPAHGTVTLSGGSPARPVGKGDAAPATPIIATYTPAPNYAGTDSFTFVAVGPGGSSSPGTVTITVVGQVPVPVAKVASTGDGQMVSVMLTDGAIRGPFTGANVVSVSPASSATTAIVASGSGASAAYRLDITPNNRFGGTIVVTYTLSNAYGTSAPSTVTLTVQARPDPRNDPNVGAISDAQSEATRRFARAQVSNFMRRTEQLHNGGGQAGMAMGMTLTSGDVARMERPDDRNWGLGITERMRVSGEDPAIGQFANNPQSPLSRSDQLGFGRTIAPTGTGAASPGAGAPKAAADTNEDGTRRTGSVATWAGGAIDIGTRDRTTDRDKVTATTAGLSAGADVKLADGVVVGLGGGYGNDLSRIGTGAQVRGTSTLYAAYASLQPAAGMFVDGVVGHGQLDFTTRRIAAAVNATARGSRDGSYTVAAISLGIDRSDGALQWSVYGRGEFMDADLDAYTESGAGRYNLRFDARQVRSLTGTLGGRIEYRQKVDFGSITPRVRAEWNHEFSDVDVQWLDYADIPGAAAYALAGNGWKREQLQLSLGTRFDILSGGWSFDFETGLRAGQGEKAGTLQLRLSKQF